MDVTEVTEFIKNVLRKSDSLQYCEHFKGIDDKKIKSYSFEDLQRVLPSSEEGELAAAEIKAQIELAIMMEKVREEKRAGGNVSSFFKPTEIEDQATGMDESGTGIDGISMETVGDKPTEIEVVTLDSDEEDRPEDNSKSCESSDEDSEYSFTASESDEGNHEPQPAKRQRPLELASKSGPQVGVSKTKSTSVLNIGSRRIIPYKCGGSRKKRRKNQQWDDEKQGQHFTTINAYQWSWKPLSSRRQNNLFRVLRNSPNVEKLNIFYDPFDTPADIELPEGSLLKLKQLRICHRRNMNIANLLRTILKMATNLKIFEYKFSVETEEDLGLLGDFDWSTLQSLSVFSLSSPSYLTKAHVESLLRIRAPKLRELEVGIGLYDDVSGQLLQNLLKNFPTIQVLYIPGQYYSHADAHPMMTIEFPKLSHLKFLTLGSKYYYAAIATAKKNGNHSALKQTSPKAKPFPVTLQFCRILSKLKTLTVGSMYHIDSLHMKNFPKLEELYVGSQWHLSVVFPKKNSRNFNYPLITSLQLPDGLNDASFVRNIPERFPNVKKCYIHLPSARVLRTFFNVMKDVGLKELHLRTRFDFLSTLESCILDKVLPVTNTSEDWKRVTKLETCVEWNNFVDQHKIILPLRNDEEVQAFVEATGEYGLGALRHLDKFTLSHEPRILDLAVKEISEAATTRVKLGYKKYPIPIECCDVVRLTSTKFWWNLEDPAGEREKCIEAGQWASTPYSDGDGDSVKIEAVSAIPSNLKEVAKQV